MKITIISASSRQNSNSVKVQQYLAQLLSQSGDHTVNCCDFENCDIPMVGRGKIDLNNLSDFQNDLISKWKEAELVLLVAPEYNWITSGELINALHQLGTTDFAFLFDNKVFGLVGVSSGRGGRRPGLELTTLLNKLISFLGKFSVVSPKIFESQETQKNLSDSGESLGNAVYEKGIDRYLQYTLSLANRWHRQDT